MRSVPAIAAVVLLALVGCAASWGNGGFSDSPEAVKYGTYDWVAQHALDWLPAGERAWLEENPYHYLYGTELSNNRRAPDGIGDMALHHVYFSRAGELTDDPAAKRAQEEFDAAVSLLALRSVVEVAKHAGAMTHYVADLAVWRRVMSAETDRGDERFKDRVIELLNLAVNLVTDCLHTLYTTLVDEDKWVPAALDPGWVTVNISVARVITANVTITFPSSGFKVVDWGEPVKEDGRFVVDIEVRKWTGVSLPVLSPTSHTYELGELEPGSYEFIVRSAGSNVASAKFTVEGLAPLANTLLVAAGVAAVTVVALILARGARLISPGGEE